MTKWIKFSRPKKSDSGKTQIWTVLGSNEVVLGQIRWFGQWRKYVFHPSAYTIYEQDCLRKIADFCEDKSKKLRRRWRTRK